MVELEKKIDDVSYVLFDDADGNVCLKSSSLPYNTKWENLGCFNLKHGKRDDLDFDIKSVDNQLLLAQKNSKLGYLIGNVFDFSDGMLEKVCDFTFGGSFGNYDDEERMDRFKLKIGESTDIGITDIDDDLVLKALWEYSDHLC